MTDVIRHSTSLRFPFAYLANKRRKVVIRPESIWDVERFSPSAGGAGLVRDIQPPDHRRRSCGVVPWVIPSQQLHLRLVATTPISFETESSRAVVRCRTMGLSEARGLVLFRVIRGGIGVTQRLGATSTVSSTGHSHTHPRNRSVSRSRLATTREDHRRWRGSSPETLKRLAISVFLRRSFLPSSTESA